MWWYGLPLRPLPAVATLLESECVGVALQMLAIVGEDYAWTGVRNGSSDLEGGIDDGYQKLDDATNVFMDQYEAYLESGVATDSFCLQFLCVLPVLDANTLLLRRHMHCCNVTHGTPPRTHALLQYDTCHTTSYTCIAAM